MRSRSSLGSVALAALLAVAIVGPSWPGSEQPGRFGDPNRPEETVYLPNCSSDQARPVWCSLAASHEP